MLDNRSLSKEQITQAIGFDPFAQSDSVYACALIERGKRAGFWCVFTDSSTVDLELAVRNNFADASWGVFDGESGQMQTRSKSGLVYTYSPVDASQPLRKAG